MLNVCSVIDVMLVICLFFHYYYGLPESVYKVRFVLLTVMRSVLVRALCQLYYIMADSNDGSSCRSKQSHCSREAREAGGRVEQAQTFIMILF